MSPRSSTGDSALRTFVALEIPAECRKQLVNATDVFRDRFPAWPVRWVQPEALHLTLRFIGNVASQQVPVLMAALQEAVCHTQPFTLRVGRPRCFPNEHSPRVLWVGVDGDLQSLSVLQSKVANSTGAWGKVEDRGFHAHITLGRVTAGKGDGTSPGAEFVRQVSFPNCEPWQVDAVHLIQSRLGAGGSHYSTLASCRLPG